MTPGRWLVQLPGRWLAPLLLASFALLAALLNYGLQWRAMDERITAQESARLRERLGLEQTLAELQTSRDTGVLERRLVGSLGQYSGLERAWLVQGDGLVLASLSRADIGRPLQEVLGPQAGLFESWGGPSGESRASEVRVVRPSGSQRVVGMAPIQPDRQLLTLVDLGPALAAREADLRNEVLREALSLLVLSALLAWVLHHVWFLRAQRLVHTLSDIGRGQLEARSGLQGRDELARIGQEIDLMAQRLQTDQAEIRRLNTVVNRSPAVVIEWRDAPGCPVDYVNDAVSQWGYGKADWLDASWRFDDLIHPEDMDRVRTETVRHREHGPDEFQQEYRLHRADGGWAWVGDRTTLRRDGEGRVVGSSGILVDITPQKTAQVAAIEQAELLRLFYELPFIGMAISSPTSRRWLQVNDRLCEILGYGRDELLSKTWAEMTPEPDLQINMGHFNEMLAGWCESYQLGKRFVRKDGDFVHTEIHVRAVRHADGSLKHLFTTIQDVSERVRAEAALQASKAELERRVAERTEQLSEANRELEAFSYSVSHDLKAPLRGIDGYSQLLQEEYADRLDDDGRQFLGRIRRGVQQMSDLIADLLDYSRMERRAMALQPVDLGQLVDEVVEGHAADIDGSGCALRRTLEPMTLVLDREGMAVVLRNLIGNAVKFSRASALPSVEVGSRSEAGRRILWVRDNGVGFDMKYHDRIFGIFQRLHRAEDYPGTGVGLALVAKAVQRMGGRVWAESSPGAGATFYLEFPA